MVKGLTATSSPLQIGAFVAETAANTFNSQQIDLSLNPLDNEVFVVTQVNLDVEAPDSVAGVTTQTSASLSSTARLTVGSITDANVLGQARRTIVCNAAMTPDGGIPFDREDPLFAAQTEDYLGIIATSDAFLNVIGSNNGNTKGCAARIYGYRAKAQASVYAALVQSEVLSA